jgi:hypothetical protein
MRIFAAVASLILAALVAVGLMLPNFTVSIPEAAIQEKVSQALPIGWKVLGAEASIDALTLDLQPDGTFAVQGSGKASGYAMAGAVALDATTRMDYRNGAFYLADLGIGDIAIDLDDASAAVLEERTTLFGALKDRAAEAIGQNDGAAVTAAKAEMERIQAALLNKGRTAIDNGLANTPVYDLANAPGLLAWAPLAISDVQVQDQAIAVTLSPSGLIGALALRGVILAFSFLAALGMVFATFAPNFSPNRS